MTRKITNQESALYILVKEPGTANEATAQTVC